MRQTVLACPFCKRELVILSDRPDVSVPGCAPCLIRDDDLAEAGGGFPKADAAW